MTITAVLPDARLFPLADYVGTLAGNSVISAAATLEIATGTTLLSVTGTMAFTLPDGTYTGQRHRVECVLAASTPLGTLTVTTPETVAGFACASTFIFNNVGQAIEFRWTGSKWRATRVQRAGVLAVTVGTTVLTGFNLNLQYGLSVTSTVSSTTTKGLPNGSSAGERVSLTNTVAASTPIGDISGTFTNMLGVAATSIGAIGVVASASVVGDTAVLEWDGSSWVCIYLAGVTFA